MVTGQMSAIAFPACVGTAADYVWSGRARDAVAAAVSSAASTVAQAVQPTVTVVKDRIVRAANTYEEARVAARQAILSAAKTVGIGIVERITHPVEKFDKWSALTVAGIAAYAAKKGYDCWYRHVLKKGVILGQYYKSYYNIGYEDANTGWSRFNYYSDGLQGKDLQSYNLGYDDAKAGKDKAKAFVLS